MTVNARSSWMPIALAMGILSCGDPEPSSPPGTPIGPEDTSPRADTSHWHEDAAFELVPFPIIEDNLANDTLLVQVTFDMKDGSYMMVASSQEETFEGLRLYRYRMDPDGSPKMLAISSPAYDSWTMLPTFFEAAEAEGMYIVLANFGEKQSWGQKVMLLDDGGFKDLCFLDVALPQWSQEEDTAYRKLLNVGPRARITEDNGLITVEFAGDSLYLFDDLRGAMDRAIEARRVRYELKDEVLHLAIDGQALPVKKPG